VVFLITHRLSTIRRADQILFLENGRIVEAGSHDALVARGGAYDALVRAESGASAAGSAP
jgi:ATP-binding cassette subfamily B protein